MLLIKIGGGKEINIDAICEDIASLVIGGERVIVVHGASVIRDEVASQLGVPTKTITSPSGVSSVYTDRQALDVLLMTYAGLVNKKIVASLQKHCVNAVGLSGIDGRLWEAKRKEIVYSVENGKTKLIRDNLTGRVEKINTDLIELLVHNWYIPVITAPAISFDNEIVNTDNDFATAIMVGSLNIKKMVVLFEAPGLLEDVNNQESIIKKVRKNNLDKYMKYAKGRMKKKLIGAQKAFDLGLETMYFGDGRIEHPIFSALEGKGTMIS